jgi:hypothetical protein
MEKDLSDEFVILSNLSITNLLQCMKSSGLKQQFISDIGPDKYNEVVKQMRNESTIIGMRDFHNWIKLDKFMEGINKPFKRIVTAHLIGKLKEEYRPIFRKLDNMKGISEDLHSKLETLEKYENDYNPGYMSGDTERIIFTTLLEIAEKNNLFDGEIYPIYQEVKVILEKFPFIKSVFDVMKSWGDDQPLQQVVVDLLKYNKHKVNLNRYTVKLTEDLPLEQELTEESIEQLQD